MANVVDYVYDENIISSVTGWNYGTNWPVVYVYYNSVKAYVGETLDAVRRTEQHRSEKQFDEFTNICFITSKTFNKSVIISLNGAMDIPLLIGELTPKSAASQVIDDALRKERPRDITMPSERR